MNAVVLLGPPGAGKGTVSEVLVGIGYTHVSTGALLRDQIRLRTPIGVAAKKLMDTGQFVPDEVVNEMVDALLKSAKPDEKFLFDGFPRTLEQAAQLDQFMMSRGGEVTDVVLLGCPDEVIINRLGGRRMCTSCGATYHLKYNPTDSSDFCKLDGGVLELRADDRPETVKKRLAVYAERTAPVVCYYQEKGIINSIDASLSIEEVRASVLRELEEE